MCGYHWSYCSHSRDQTWGMVAHHPYTYFFSLVHWACWYFPRECSMNVNVNAQLFIAQELVPLMQNKKKETNSDDSESRVSPRILHIGTAAAHRYFTVCIFSQQSVVWQTKINVQDWSTYCVSKAAFFMLHEALKNELKPLGILVGSVMPGVVETPMQVHVYLYKSSVCDFLTSFEIPLYYSGCGTTQHSMGRSV